MLCPDTAYCQVMYDYKQGLYQVFRTRYTIENVKFLKYLTLSRFSILDTLLIHYNLIKVLQLTQNCAFSNGRPRILSVVSYVQGSRCGGWVKESPGPRCRGSDTLSRAPGSYPKKGTPGRKALKSLPLNDVKLLSLLLLAALAGRPAAAHPQQQRRENQPSADAQQACQGSREQSHRQNH